MKLFKLFIPLLLMASACSLVANRSATDDTRPPIGETVGIDTSPEAQAKFKAEWLANTQAKVFVGTANIWGAGAFGIQDFAFDAAGNLHNNSRQRPKWYSTHRVLAFKSGTQAAVRFYNSASSTLYNEIYALELSNGKIYRTQNIDAKNASRGFSTVSTWNGKVYSSANMEEFGAFDGSVAPPTLNVPAENS